MSDTEPFCVEVAYALPDRQKIIELLVAPGTTAFVAAGESKITDYFPEIDLENAKMGVFGQALGTKGLKPPREYVLKPGERVEIYRPLVSDPKEVRRRRAEKSREQRSD